MAKSTIKPSSAIADGISDFKERANAISQDMTEEVKKEEVKTEKSKKEQLVNFKLPIDKYEEYKKMFGAEGFSFSKGNRMCLDYILREIRDGNLELTESGFRKTAFGRVGR
ncbi:MAG: hypothetical protein U0K92_10780 [Treponema sp.]|nr:hypothetical protein [Treponema sp.]